MVSVLAMVVVICAAVLNFVLAHVGLQRLRKRHPEVWQRYGRPALLDYQVKPPNRALGFAKEVFQELNDPMLKFVLIAIGVNSIVGVVMTLLWWRLSP